MRLFISCLGAGRYTADNYYLQDKSKTCKSTYIQRSILELLSEDEKPDQVVIFTTDLAKERHWSSEEGLENELKEVCPKLGIKVPKNSVMIPDGKNEEEIWTIFETILNELHEGDEVVADITHAFRYIPMLMMSVLNYAKTVKKIKVLNVYYGAHEATGDDGLTPIFSLGLYDRILDWTDATNSFLKYGDSKSFVSMAKEDLKEQRRDIVDKSDFMKYGKIEKLAAKLDTFTSDIETCRGNVGNRFKIGASTSEAYRQFSNILNEVIEENNQILKPLTPLLEIMKKETQMFDSSETGLGEQMTDLGLALARWCIDKNKIPQALTAMEETCITYICTKLGDSNRAGKQDYRECFGGAALACAGKVFENATFTLNARSKEYLTETEIAQVYKAGSILGDAFVNTARNIQDMRNDVNHFGIRTNPSDSSKIITRTEGLYEEMVATIANQKKAEQLKKNIKVLLAPTYDMARKAKEEMQITATVEAEYGEYCVEGEEVTLAHHGSRSMNPAPCNTPDVKTLEEGTILLSHIDLDALGGVLDLMGIKPEDEAFWRAAEKMDVEGMHHSHELEESEQDKLNAYYEWNGRQEHRRYTELTDVTDIILQGFQELDLILNKKYIEKYIGNKTAISRGKKWREEATKRIEKNLVKETEQIRCFISDGVFCSAAYYSPKYKKIIPATIVLDLKLHSITVAFADGGTEHSAVKLVRELWGEEAGGRDGIAGGPRSWEISEEELRKEFERCCQAVADLF